MAKVIPILKLRPSHASTWLHCAAAPLLERDEPDSSSGYADEGTAAHFLASTCLTEGVPASAYVFRNVNLHDDGTQSWEPLGGLLRKHQVQVVEGMVPHVQGYLDYCLRVADGADAMLVEQRIDLSEVFGLANQSGTADCVVIDGETLHVIDLKYGQGDPVNVEDNEQLMIYAAGAVRAHGLLNDFKRIMLHVYQPRIDNISTWEFGIEKLEAFEERVRQRVVKVRDIYDTEVHGPEDFGPSATACKWCKARPCEAMTGHALKTISDDFEDLDAEVAATVQAATAAISKADHSRLGQLNTSLPFVKLWMNAVADRVSAVLNAGEHVPGWKLVEGRQGNRAWGDAIQAEAMLKTMRLKDEVMYDFKLISPTTAEKLAKAKIIGPRQWPKLEALIGRADGKPTVVPESDTRPALAVTPALDDFETLDEVKEITQEQRARGLLPVQHVADDFETLGSLVREQYGADAVVPDSADDLI